MKNLIPAVPVRTGFKKFLKIIKNYTMTLLIRKLNYSRFPDPFLINMKGYVEFDLSFAIGILESRILKTCQEIEFDQLFHILYNKLDLKIVNS